MNDFVAGSFPLPQNSVGLRDFVPGGFPLPQMPVLHNGLPKAPPIQRAQIGNGAAAAGVSGCGCGMPGYYGGMGTLATTDFGLVSGDTIIPQASLPTFLQGDNWITGFPNLYVALGAGVIALVVIGSQKKGRR